MIIPERLADLRAGASLDGLSAVVEKRISELADLRGGAIVTANLFAEYQRWARDAIDLLRPAINSATIDWLVRTPAYWTLQNAAYGTSSAPTNLMQLVLTEAADRELTFQDLQQQIQVVQEWREHPGALVAIDTNIYIEHPQRTNDLAEVDWHTLTGIAGPLRLLVPLIVVDELDGLKRTLRAVPGDPFNGRARSRAVARQLADRIQDPRELCQLSADVTVELLLDETSHERFGHNDSEFTDRMRVAQMLAGRPISVLTADSGMAFRAKAAGLDATLVDFPDRN